MDDDYPTKITLDQVLWEFAMQYRKLFGAKNPSIELSEYLATLAALKAFEAYGHAAQHVERDGNVVWKATSKFLESTELEAGPLITLTSSLEMQT